ncbi:MAG: VWA domain-containing protein [Trueperaceae bacterium]|nr:MAG: VWA domain-containing protein [Trueperaceae bacterium]
MGDYTEIIAIIDRSGSMRTIKEEAIGGFNAFVDAQMQVPGEAALTLVLFDHESALAYQARGLDDAPRLNEQNYIPRGTTALLDAIGLAVDQAGQRFAAMAESDRPGKVIVCILTDGIENASDIYSRNQVAEMIKHQHEVYKWEFVFLAADQDAFEVGSRLNIPAQTTFDYTATREGTVAAYEQMSRTVMDLRTEQATVLTS